MKTAVVVAALVFAGACKKKETAPASTGSGSGSSVASAPADAAAAAPEPAPGPAVLEQEDVDGESNPELLAAFGKQMPKLPAINADGTLIATLDDVSGGPAIPPAMQLTIRKFPSGDKAEELPVLAYEEAMHAGESGDQWLTPELAKQLTTRGKAIVAKLAGFHSLHEVKLEQVDSSSYEVNPTKIGDLVFTAKISGMDSLVVTLQTAAGKMVHREVVEGYGHREKGQSIDDMCNYSPVMGQLWTDPPKPRALYVETRFRYRDDCVAPESHYIVWSTDPNSTTPAEQMAEIVGRQFDLVGADDAAPILREIATDDSLAISNHDVAKHLGTPGPPEAYEGHTDSNVTITMSADGKSAWASTESTLAIPRRGEDNTVDMRASNLLVQTPKGWRTAAFAWSEPTENDLANKQAKSGSLKAGKLTADPGDAELNAAFAKLTTDGATIVAKDLVAFGSGPNERTVGGPAFAKPWNAAWKGKTMIVSSVARLAPSGTTGWVAATVELQKKGYKIPFTVFAVFDKVGGAWTLVHIHFAV